MKRLVKSSAIIVMALIVCMLFSSFRISSGSNERVWAEIRKAYRNSSLIITGSCFRTHINESNKRCCDVSVDQVLAGNTNDSVLHFAETDMAEGEQYLLYLTPDNDAVYYMEDSSRYSIVTEHPVKLTVDGKASFGASAVSLNELRRDMNLQKETVVAPINAYYYKALNSLINDTSNVFIGRAVSVSPYSDTHFYSSSESSTVENTLDASTVNILVFSSVKGALRYGDKISMIYCPGLYDEMTDAASLKTVPGSNEYSEIKAGSNYLFFLNPSPDPKQGIYFPVNAVQCAAEILPDDRLVFHNSNRALQGYYNLDVLIKRIHTVN